MHERDAVEHLRSGEERYVHSLMFVFFSCSRADDCQPLVVCVVGKVWEISGLCVGLLLISTRDVLILSSCSGRYLVFGCAYLGVFVRSFSVHWLCQGSSHHVFGITFCCTWAATRELYCDCVLFVDCVRLRCCPVTVAS